MKKFRYFLHPHIHNIRKQINVICVDFCRSPKSSAQLCKYLDLAQTSSQISRQTLYNFLRQSPTISKVYFIQHVHLRHHHSALPYSKQCPKNLQSFAVCVLRLSSLSFFLYDLGWTSVKVQAATSEKLRKTSYVCAAIVVILSPPDSFLGIKKVPDRTQQHNTCRRYNFSWPKKPLTWHDHQLECNYNVQLSFRFTLYSRVAYNIRWKRMMKVKLLYHNSFVIWKCSLLVSGPVDEFNILATWLTRELIYLLLLIFFPET